MAMDKRIKTTRCNGCYNRIAIKGATRKGRLWYCASCAKEHDLAQSSYSKYTSHDGSIDPSSPPGQ